MHMSRLVTSLLLCGCILASATIAQSAGAKAQVNSNRIGKALANAGASLFPVASLYQAPQIRTISVALARHVNSTWANLAWDKLAWANLTWANLTWDVALDDAGSNPACGWEDLALSSPEEVD